jgi:hypothetical protein
MNTNNVLIVIQKADTMVFCVNIDIITHVSLYNTQLLLNLTQKGCRFNEPPKNPYETHVNIRSSKKGILF